MEWNPPAFENWKLAPVDEFGWSRQASLNNARYACSVCAGELDGVALACGCIHTHLRCESCLESQVHCCSTTWVKIAVPRRKRVPVFAEPGAIGNFMAAAAAKLSGISWTVDENIATRPWFTIQHGGQPVRRVTIQSTIADIYGAPFGLWFKNAQHSATGAKIFRIDEDSGAARSGLKVGDIVVGVNEENTRGMTAKETSSIIVAETWTNGESVDIYFFRPRQDERGGCPAYIVHAIQEEHESLMVCAMLFKKLNITEATKSVSVGGSIEICNAWITVDGVRRNTGRIVLVTDGCLGAEVQLALSGCTSVVLTRAFTTQVAHEVMKGVEKFTA